jgi:ABC-type Fe3+-siderophore transport system permease subunit
VTTVSVSGSGAPAGAPERRLVGLAVAVVGAVLLAVGFCWAVSIGPQPIGLHDLILGIVHPDKTVVNQLIVHEIRLPRAILAGVVGACLAVSGAIMQSITANPLGSPEILGINAGAAFVVVLSLTLAPGLQGFALMPLAFTGAALAAALVFGMARYGRGGLSPARLALAGVTVSFLLFALVQGSMILSQEAADTLFYWLIGGVTYADWSQVRTLVPFAIGGVLAAFLLAHRLNVLGLGEDMARGLGQNVARTRLAGALVVVVLAGGAVGVAGPVGFVGLMTPHIVRKLVGFNHFVVLPLSALLGAALLAYSDIVARYLNRGFETPAGIVTALIGAPFFIYLARRQRWAG